MFHTYWVKLLNQIRIQIEKIMATPTYNIYFGWNIIPITKIWVSIFNVIFISKAIGRWFCLCVFWGTAVTWCHNHITERKEYSGLICPLYSHTLFCFPFPFNPKISANQNIWSWQSKALVIDHWSVSGSPLMSSCRWIIDLQGVGGLWSPHQKSNLSDEIALLCRHKTLILWIMWCECLPEKC